MVTPAYKWLRAVGDHEFTGLHMDRVFMGRSPRMLTAWIPLGDIPIAQGPILVSLPHNTLHCLVCRDRIAEDLTEACIIQHSVLGRKAIQAAVP